jgi:hypothetical protein
MLDSERIHVTGKYCSDAMLAALVCQLLLRFKQPKTTTLFDDNLAAGKPC